MKYSRGDVVEFKVESDETQKGQVQFVEENYNEEILYVDSYVDSFSGWAYKVPEKRIISKLTVKNPGTYSEMKRFAGNRRHSNSIYHSEPPILSTSEDFKTFSIKSALCTATHISEQNNVQ